MELTVMLILSISFSIFLIMGTPVSAAMALASFLALLPLYDPLLAAQLIGHNTISAIDNFGFLAIPFFILAGNLMNVGGIAKRMIDFAKVIFGPIPGALAYCNVLANLLFGAVSGSAVAAASAIGSTMAPMQKKEGYNGSFCAAVNISSSPAGLLIPPSNALLLFALTAGGVSVVGLFIAGYLPGLIMGLATLAVIFFKRKSLPKGDRSQWTAPIFFGSFLKAIPSLFMIIAVIGGMVTGIFTPTESSVIAVLYSAMLAAFYREMKWSDLQKVLVQSVMTTCVVLFLIATSSAMSWVFSVSDIPQYVSDTMLSLSEKPWVLILLMNIILLLVGTFMDLTPMILIFTPIFYPVAMKIGMHPIHFGIMMTYNSSIGIMTPPVGSALFVGSMVSGEPLKKINKELMPMFAAQIVGLLIVSFWPALSLWLPQKMGLL